MRPATHPTPVIAPVRLPRRRLAMLATILAAGAAGAVTIAVVDDGDSGTGAQSLGGAAADIRYDGGPNEGVAALSIRSQPPVARPVEGAAVQAMRSRTGPPVTRPVEGAAVQAMHSQPASATTRPVEGAAVQAMGSRTAPPVQELHSHPRLGRPDEGVAVRSIGR